MAAVQEQEERWAAEERRRAEQARVVELRTQAAAWAEAHRIREYVAARLKEAPPICDSLRQIETWAEWAAKVADSVDPLHQELSYRLE